MLRKSCQQLLRLTSLRLNNMNRGRKRWINFAIGARWLYNDTPWKASGEGNSWSRFILTRRWENRKSRAHYNTCDYWFMSHSFFNLEVFSYYFPSFFGLLFSTSKSCLLFPQESSLVFCFFSDLITLKPLHS